MALFAVLPVEVGCTEAAVYIIKGLTPGIVLRVAEGLALLGDCANLRVVRGRCCCSVKNAVVPADLAQGWDSALADTPLEGCARASWPCLGITVASKAPNGRGDGRAQLALVRHGSWDKPLGKLEVRAGLIFCSHASLGRRAAAWNTYCDPLMLYPAHAVLPGALETSRARAGYARALRRGRGR